MVALNLNEASKDTQLAVCELMTKTGQAAYEIAKGLVELQEKLKQALDSSVNRSLGNTQQADVSIKTPRAGK